ncbi:MAG: nicotinamide mononucleotide transporter [Clostridia bacterium]|nr:nicotinamide mononucleotide transporter [Clostridia bacterium]
MQQKWTKFEKIWIVSIFLLMTIVVYKNSNGWMSNVVAITGVLSTFLFAKQTRVAYLFSIINTLLYGIIVFNNAIYASAVYNLLYNFPMQIYGLIYWTKSKKREDLGIKTLSFNSKIKETAIIIPLIIIATIVLKHFNGNLVVLDSIIMVLSYVAVFLMTNKYLEQWIVWMIVNFTGVIMWGILTYQDHSNISLLVMWIIFLLNSIYGFINWHKIVKDLKKLD